MLKSLLLFVGAVKAEENIFLDMMCNFGHMYNFD